MVTVTSRWEGRGEDAQLIWNINGEDVSDRDLRGWCFSHLPYPYSLPGCITKLHTDAYAARNIIGEGAAVLGVTFAEMWWAVQRVITLTRLQPSPRLREAGCA